MSNVIQNMISNVVGDGARETKFQVYLSFPHNNLNVSASDIPIMMKTAQFPGKSLDIMDFKYKGRTVPLKAQVKYEQTWACTFYLTEDHHLKRMFENWIEAIDQSVNYSTDLSKQVKQSQSIGTNYSETIIITQLDFGGNREVCKYTIHNAFPISVESVSLDYGSVAKIIEFKVEFAYSHFDSESLDAKTSTKAEDIRDKFNATVDDAISSAKGAVAGAITSAISKNNPLNKLKSGKKASSNTPNGVSSADNMISRLE